jgi:hypothetical protein
MAKKAKGKSKGRVAIRKAGKKPITFEKGKLHRALGVPEGEKIPDSKKRAALSGRLGGKIKKMAVFAFKGALAEGRRTAQGKRQKKRAPHNPMTIEERKAWAERLLRGHRGGMQQPSRGNRLVSAVARAANTYGQQRLHELHPTRRRKERRYRRVSK